ncbi:Uncharacterised protein [Yersinia pseudotuberculosis]|nr:putative membrane protein [Yersinia pseudotuberculosis]CNK06066.1 Uncharacterised protein [Yersinia pseudotuberculosis]CNK82411.1 Uncharacterised protein [Yersinia pseudotuberculosis]SUP90631.1 Uncharacterised protein [Yersinia pseudotuberculosis]
MLIFPIQDAVPTIIFSLVTLRLSLIVELTIVTDLALHVTLPSIVESFIEIEPLVVCTLPLIFVVSISCCFQIAAYS